MYTTNAMIRPCLKGSFWKPDWLRHGFLWRTMANTSTGPSFKNELPSFELAWFLRFGVETNSERTGTPQTQGPISIYMDVIIGSIEIHIILNFSWPECCHAYSFVLWAGGDSPWEMLAAASERPHEMARYSVSDAVWTYFLYTKNVHLFVYFLCNISPLSPDVVLWKGSGTLCEMLLMCQAREKRIVATKKPENSAIGKPTRDGPIL